MRVNVESYRALIRMFLNGSISSDDFSLQFMNRFKAEDADMDDNLFETLDGLFSDADAYTDDDILLRENASFYISGKELRRRAEEALRKLSPSA